MADRMGLGEDLGGGARARLQQHLASALLVAVATCLCLATLWLTPIRNLSLLYITAVLFSAKWFGFWPSMTAVVLGALSYDFFFLPPYYSLSIDNKPDMVAFALFVVVAFVVSNLTAQTQRQAQKIAEHARAADELYLFGRKVGGTGTLTELLRVATREISELFGCKVVLLLLDSDQLQAKCAFPPEEQLDGSAMREAYTAWAAGTPRTPTPEATTTKERVFIPLQFRRRSIGVVAVSRPQRQPLLASERRLLDAVVSEMAAEIERVQLAEEAERAHMRTESERLRNALLTSISHDLRTPLAGIMGALVSLKQLGANYDEGSKRELISVALEDTERLDRFVGNLLDMTKLEAGRVGTRRERTELGDVVSAAIRHAGFLLSAHKISVDLEEQLPEVEADCILLERVLFNLIDNAAKYGPPGSEIRIFGRAEEEAVLLQVIDEGPGIPPAALTLVFDKFTRLEAEDRCRAGTGLGLPICRGFVEAMAGSIIASNREDRSGAILSVRLRAAAPLLALEAHGISDDT